LPPLRAPLRRRGLVPALVHIGWRVWVHWSGPTAARISGALTLAGFALLFLDAAGTIELVYTITPSYLLLGAACVVGAPLVLRGWQTLPPGFRWAAFALVAVYVAADFLGELTAVPGQERSTAFRDAVYVTDLLLGLATISLVAGRWPRRESIRPLLAALAAGAVVAALYALYQLPARELAWPFADINNAINTTGVSYGEQRLNDALFGRERVRGTFAEPHFLAGYLAALGVLLLAFVGWRRLPGVPAVLAVAGVVMLVAMAFTASTPGWVILGLATVAGASIAAVGRGYVLGATVAGIGLALVLVIVPVLLSSPTLLTPVTGRQATELTLTTDYRKESWNEAIDIWAARPVLGYGPGQSAVKLAQEPTAAPNSDILVLGSAQGLWAATLVDTGVVGLGAWIVLLGVILLYAGRTLFRSLRLANLAIFIATAAAVGSAQVVGDRLKLYAWAVFAVALAAAARCPAEPDSHQRDS